MLSQEPGNRAFPTLVTLLVVGLLLMTFDVRSQGEGVVRVLRSGAQSIVSPLQKGTAFVVSPVVELVDSLSDVASLRARNTELERALAEAQAALIAVDDDLARLALLEEILDLEATGTELGRTVAEVIGRPSTFDGALFISKGSNDGVNVGQPVIDTQGFVVGTVTQVTGGAAIVVPITVGASGVGVAVGDQLGTVVPQVNTNILRLDIFGAREPIFDGDQVVTSSVSVRFPAGYPIGEIDGDAAPVSDTITATVVPFSNPDTLRVVVVLAWPPDPVTAATERPAPPTTSTTSTTSTTVGEG